MLESRLVPIARRNLLAEKGRLAMSVGGVAFAVLLVLIITSLYRGWGGASALFGEFPGDLWVAQAGTHDPFRSSSHVPADRVAAVARVPGVRAAIPVYGRRIAFRAGKADADVYFFSLDVPSGLALPAATREAFLPPAGRVVIDRVFASEADLATGDEIAVLGHTLEVERVRPEGNPLFEVAFLDAADGRALLGLEGYVSFVLVSLAPGADPGAVAGEIGAAAPGTAVRTSAEFADSMSDLVDRGFLPVVGVLVAIGLVVGGAVIALTIYTATIERARDFGVLKAVGASGSFLYRIVVAQSLIVGTTGSAIGVGAAALAASLIKRGVPEFVTDLRPLDAAWLLLAAVGVSLVAAWIPVRRIDRIDPAIVFRA